MARWWLLLVWRRCVKRGSPSTTPKCWSRKAASFPTSRTLKASSRMQRNAWRWTGQFRRRPSPNRRGRCRRTRRRRLRRPTTRSRRGRRGYRGDMHVSPIKNWCRLLARTFLGPTCWTICKATPAVVPARSAIQIRWRTEDSRTGSSTIVMRAGKLLQVSCRN